MGVSFKVAKVGTRFRQKITQTEETDDGVKEKPSTIEGDFVGANVADFSDSLAHTGSSPLPEDLEVSFTLNLFPDGFSIGKAIEGILLPLFQGVPKQLLPYGWASKKLFSAIEYGLLPVDIFDDRTWKYIDGTLTCEVRDYRKCMPRFGCDVSSRGKAPTIHKLRLEMCTENVVKDISSFLDESWSYNDLLEVESRILKSLQPELHLDPAPLFDRLSRPPRSRKLNLGIFGGMEKKKVIDLPVVKLTSDNFSKSQSHLALSNSGVPCAEQEDPTRPPSANQNNTVQKSTGSEFSIAFQPGYQATISCSRPVLTSDDTSSMPVSYLTNSYGAPLLGKRDSSETQPAPSPRIKSRKQVKSDLNQVKHGMNSLLLKQVDTDKKQCTSPQLLHDSPPASLEGAPRIHAAWPLYLHHKGGECIVKQELVDVMDIEVEQYNHLQTKVQDSSPYARSHILSSVQLNGMDQLVDKDWKRKGVTQNKKSSRNPHVCSADVFHSPASSRSGEISSILSIPLYNTSTTSIGLNDKSKYMYGTLMKSLSVNSGHDTLKRQKHSSISTKRKSISLPKSSSGVGSPASVSPFCKNGPVGNSSRIEADTILKRFLKIEIASKRCGFHSKKERDNFLGRQSFSCASHLVAFQLSQSDDTNNLEGFETNENSMSTYIFGGDRNVCKTRVLTFIRELHVYERNGFPVVLPASRIELVISETSNDVLVEEFAFCADEEESNTVTRPLHSLLHVPNTHFADLYAAQFTLLMKGEHYLCKSDQIKPLPFQTILARSSQQASVERCPPVLVPGQLLYKNSPTNNNISVLNSGKILSRNTLAGTCCLPPGNTESALQLSSGCLSSSQILDTSSQNTSLHQQHPQSQRPSRLIASTSNLLGSTRMHTGNPMLNNPANVQFLRNTMDIIHPCVGALGLGNLVGVGSFSYMLGMGRRVPVMRNSGQINNNLSSQVASNCGNLNKQHPSGGNILDPRIVHIRGRGTHIPKIINDGVNGMGLTHVGALFNRGEISQFQHHASVTLRDTPNILAMQQQQMQQHQEQLCSQQHQQQQQQLQQLVSLSEQAGSPLSHVTSQTHMSPHQIREELQLSPQQVNLAATEMQQQVNANSAMIGGQVSPQRSSQTHGSAGSISSTPMELHGARKDNCTVKVG